MSFSNGEIDDLVDKAVREIRVARKKREHSSVVEKARELGIHKDRIHRRLKDVGSCTDRKPVNYKLSVIQEVSLVRYILFLNEISYSVRYNQINSIINIILFQNPIITIPTSFVSSFWTRRFLDRHSKLYKVK